MSFSPLNTEIIEQRLRDEIPQLEHVGGAADYAAIETMRNFRTPSVFVAPSKEKAIDGQARHVYQAHSTFGIIIAVNNRRADKGQSTLSDARPIIEAVRKALIRWMPEDRAFRECVWLEGEVLDYDKSVLLWADVFKTNFILGD